MQIEKENYTEISRPQISSTNRKKVKENERMYAKVISLRGINIEKVSLLKSTSYAKVSSTKLQGAIGNALIETVGYSTLFPRQADSNELAIIKLKKKTEIYRLCKFLTALCRCCL